MSKSDFISLVAKEGKGKISKAEAKRAVDLVLRALASGLRGARSSGRYSIGTFGTFLTSKRPAHEGRNPRTGEVITIGATKALRFRPSSHLKKAAGC